MTHAYFTRNNNRLHLWLYKSSVADDERLAYFKRKVLEALKASEQRERMALIKSLLLYIAKSGKPARPGEVRYWPVNPKNGEKRYPYIKGADGKWRPKYGDNTRGAKQSLRILQKKVMACTDAMQLLKIVTAHQERFREVIEKDGKYYATGKLYPWVPELYTFANTQLHTILAATTAKMKEEERKQDENDFGHDYTEYNGKGQEAVDFIAKNGAGQVRGAFHRDDTGDIDVVWGKVTDAKAHKGYGIAHLIDKHGEDALKHVGDVIENGTRSITKCND